MDQLARDQDQQADLSPLAWVQDELRRSLESVHKTLRPPHPRRRRQPHRLRRLTQPSVPLQRGGRQLHIGWSACCPWWACRWATVLRASEATVQRLAQNPLEVDLRPRRGH